MPPPPFPALTQPCFSTQNWSSGNVKILLNTSCSIQGARFLPSDDSRSTMKQDCFSLCLNNCLLMHTRPTVDCGFYGHCYKISKRFALMCQQTKQMTFWEIGVGLWSTAHFVYNSGRFRGGAWEAWAPPLSQVITNDIFSTLPFLLTVTSECAN